MVTRAQAIRESILRSAKNNTGNSTDIPWFLSEDVWEGLVHLVSVIADVLRAIDKPVVAVALDQAVHIAQKQVVRREDMNLTLALRLQSLSKQLKEVDQHLNPALTARLQAQIELIIDLMGNSGRSNGSA